MVMRTCSLVNIMLPVARRCKPTGRYAELLQVFGYFSRWFGLLDIITNIVYKKDNDVKPTKGYLYWHNAVLGRYPALLKAQKAMAELDLEVGTCPCNL